MVLRSALYILLVAVVTAVGASVQPHGQPDVATANAPHGPDALGRDGFAHPPDQTLLAAIAAWLATDFDLPALPVLPEVVFVPAVEMTALRLGSTLRQPSAQSESGEGRTPSHEGHDLLGLYSDAARTIYLPSGWTGSSAAEQSVLVHEMVHHLQNLTGLQYPCAEERERVAYRLQQRWLERSGRSLESEFDIDPMTLLIRTTCMM